MSTLTGQEQALLTCTECEANLVEVGVMTWQNINVPQMMLIAPDARYCEHIPASGWSKDFEAWTTGTDETFHCVGMNCGNCETVLTPEQEAFIGHLVNEAVHEASFTLKYKEN